MDDTIEEECRELLGLAATHIFSNLHRIDPKFDFSLVLRPVEPELSVALMKAVMEHVRALIEVYGRGDEAGEGGPSGQDSEEPQGDEADDGDSASST